MAAERDTVATRSGAELIPRQERWQSGKCIKSDGRRCCGVSLFFLSHLSMTYLMKRMKLVKLQSRLWNYMLLLVDVVFNTVKYREMRPRNLFPTFSSFVPEEGGVASVFRYAEINERKHKTRFFVCREKHTDHVQR